MVLVSHRHKFIFLKTRKTAGTSIEMYLEPACTDENLEISEKREMVKSPAGIVGARVINAKAGEWGPHMRAFRVKKELGEDLFDQYLKISSVRNPYDRCLSLFLWRKRSLKPNELSPDDFRFAFEFFLLNEQWHNDLQITHIKGSNILNDVIRYESLVSDLQRISALVGFKSDVGDLAITKSTKASRAGKPISDFFTKKAKDTVLKRMAWVFDEYNYSPNIEDARTG